MAGVMAAILENGFQRMITLVTATLPVRASMLAEMLATTAEQTVHPSAHIIVRDFGDGFVETVNRAVAMVDTEFFCLVDDDDLLFPHHVETLSSNLTADIVWTWVEVEGRAWNPNSSYLPGELKHRNYIPSNLAMRASLWRKMGGYRHGPEHPDWDMLARAEASGASFLNVPETTWKYRFHGGNMSLNG